MTFTDVAAWSLQVMQLVLTAFVAAGIAVLLWSIWQPVSVSCAGNQPFINQFYNPIAVSCQITVQHPAFHVGGR